MQRIKKSLFLILLLAIVACAPQTATNGPGDTATATPTLPDPQVYITPAPDVEDMIDDFMQAWQVEDYAAMYGMLTADTRAVVTEEDFTASYQNTAIALTLAFDTGVEYEVLSTMVNPDNAVATVLVTYETYLFGDLTRELTLSLAREAGGWLLVWDRGAIMPELAGGNLLEIVRQTTPRGNIYANEGSPIAAEENVVAIGFTPASLDEDLLSLFYTTMARLTIYQVDEIIEMVDNALPNDYIALGEVPQTEVDKNMSALSLLSGVYLNYYTSRFYYDGGLAPQAVGHLSYISQEGLNRYLRLGYAPNERFGSTGLENAFEDQLSGERGG